MRVFLDTEFTHLGKNAEIISVGLVSESGESLYFERTDYDPFLCNEFVSKTVIPLLDAPLSHRWKATECVSRMVEWLEDLDSENILLSDSHWDADILHEIFSIHGGIRALIPNISFSLISFPYESWRNVFSNGYLEYFKENPGKEHHALHDAKALRRGWLRMHGFY